MIFVCYSKCSTCKKAEAYLKENKIEYQSRDIKTDNPSKEELKIWIEKSGLDIRKFFNTSGLKYKELHLKEKLDQMSFDEKLDLLASDGMLVKRPILVHNDLMLIGFKLSEWQQAVSKG